MGDNAEPVFDPDQLNEDERAELEDFAARPDLDGEGDEDTPDELVEVPE